MVSQTIIKVLIKFLKSRTKRRRDLTQTILTSTVKKSMEKSLTMIQMTLQRVMKMSFWTTVCRKMVTRWLAWMAQTKKRKLRLRSLRNKQNLRLGQTRSTSSS